MVDIFLAVAEQWLQRIMQIFEKRYMLCRRERCCGAPSEGLKPSRAGRLGAWSGADGARQIACG